MLFILTNQNGKQMKIPSIWVGSEMGMTRDKPHDIKDTRRRTRKHSGYTKACRSRNNSKLNAELGAYSASREYTDADCKECGISLFL